MPQSMQVLAVEAPVVVRYLPAPQSVQVLFLEAPVVARYLPAPQSVHLIEPIASLYVPATHAEHASPSAPVYPALHRHLVNRLLPTKEIEFTGHPLHPPEPERSLYSPTRHNSHLCPSGPVAPALQVQSVRRVDPGGEFELVGQTLQVGLPASDHVPSEHGWHISTLVRRYGVFGTSQHFVRTSESFKE
jgi:hypothetical protein